MIATYRFEESVHGYIINFGGRDSAGNEIHETVELLVKANSAEECHTVEALVALLRNVDDFALKKTDEIDMPPGWEVPEGAIGKPISEWDEGNPLY